MEKGFLYTNKLDLNRVLEKFKTSEVENVQYFDSFDDYSTKWHWSLLF